MRLGYRLAVLSGQPAGVDTTAVGSGTVDPWGFQSLSHRTAYSKTLLLYVKRHGLSVVESVA